MAKKLNDTAMVTGKVRFSYASVFKPRAFAAGDPEKYSVTLLIPKDDVETITMIKSCIQAAIDEGRGKLMLKAGQKPPATFKIPLRDGDEEKPDNAEYENCMFINTSSGRAPGVVKKENGKAVSIAEEEFYSGCYGAASINFYAFNVKSKGIACGLNNIMKTEDGDRLSGGGSSAADDFGLEEEGDEFM